MGDYWCVGKLKANGIIAPVVHVPGVDGVRSRKKTHVEEVVEWQPTTTFNCT